MKDRKKVIVEGRLRLRQVVTTLFILVSAPVFMWIANIIVIFPTNPTFNLSYFFRPFSKTMRINTVILVIVMLAAIINWSAYKVFKPTLKLNGEKGREKWANENIESLKNNPKKLLKQEALVKVRVDEQRPQDRGIIHYRDDEHFYVNPEINHTLVLGPTGSGKSQAVFIPNIEFLSRLPPIDATDDLLQESFLINDIKGEHLASNIEYLKQRGYHIGVINLKSPYYSDAVNLLELTKEAYLEAFSERAVIKGDVSEAVMLADNFAFVLTNDPTSKEKIWQEGAQGLIAGVVIALCEDLIFTNPDWITPSLVQATIVEFNSTLTEDGENKLDWFFMERELGNDAKALASMVLVAEDRTKSSYISTALNALKIFSDKGIAKMTSRNTIDFKSLITKPTAIFVVVPERIKSRWKISSLIFEQASYIINKEIESKYNGVSPRIINMCVDEVGNIPALPGLKEEVSLTRAKRIRWLLGPQDNNQLFVKYGEKEGRVILNNCRTWIFLSTADQATAEAISKRIGSETIAAPSVSARDGDLIGNNQLGSSGRRLLDANEAMRLDPGEAIVTRVGKSAIKATFKLAYTYMKTGTRNIDELVDQIAEHAYLDLSQSLDYLRGDNAIDIYRSKNQQYALNILDSGEVSASDQEEVTRKRVVLNKNESVGVMREKLLHGFLSHPKYQPLEKEIRRIFDSTEFNQMLVTYLFNEQKDERSLVMGVEQFIFDILQLDRDSTLDDRLAHESEMEKLKEQIHLELSHYLTLIPDEEATTLPDVHKLRDFLIKKEVEVLLADHLFTGSTSTVTLKKKLLKLFKEQHYLLPEAQDQD